VFSADKLSEKSLDRSSGLKLPNSVLHFKILPRSDYKQKVDLVLRVKTQGARISLDSKFTIFLVTDTITIKDGRRYFEESYWRVTKALLFLLSIGLSIESQAWHLDEYVSYVGVSNIADAERDSWVPQHETQFL